MSRIIDLCNKKWFAPSVTSTLYGQKGSGKTNCAVLLIQSLVSLGVHVYTNIHFFTKEDIAEAKRLGYLNDNITYREIPKEVHVLASLKDIIRDINKPDRKVFMLDEMGLIAPSTRGTSSDVLTIQQLTMISRHFRASMMFITQSLTSITPTLRERLIQYQFLIDVRNKQRWLLGFYRTEENNEDGNRMIVFKPVGEDFGPLPLSTYPADLLFPSMLKMDVDLPKLLSKLNKLSSSIQVMGKEGDKIIKESLDEIENEKISMKDGWIEAHKLKLDVDKGLEYLKTKYPHIEWVRKTGQNIYSEIETGKIII